MREPIAIDNRDWQNLIGIQHALGGDGTGLSCYGLLREVYKGISIDLPARDEKALTADLWATEGRNWIKIPEPVPYCGVLLMDRVKDGEEPRFHIGIVTPDGQLLHCARRTGVVVSRLSKYEKYIIGYYAYKPDGGENLPAAGDGDIGRAIGMVVVAIAAVALSVPSGGTSLTLLGLEAGSFASAMAVMGITMAMGLIVNALCPQKTATPDALSGYSSSLSDSRTYTWDGIVNDTRQGLVKPLIFGQILTGGEIVSEKTWFDPINPALEYYNALICPAKNRITGFSKYYINDTDSAYYPDVTIDSRKGDDEQTVIPGFEQIYTQYNSGAKIVWDASATLPTSNHVIGFTSKTKITGARLVIAAPSGLYSMDEFTGVQSAQNVTFKVQHKKTSEDSTKWAFAYSDYAWAGGTIVSATGEFSGRKVKGFDTVVGVEGIRFDLVNNRGIVIVPGIGNPGDFDYVPTVYTYVGWSKYKVWYRKLGDAVWTLHGTYEHGFNGCESPLQDTDNILIADLPLGQYQVRVDFVDDSVGGVINETFTQAFELDNAETAAGTSDLTIVGDPSSPGTKVYKNVEIIGLDEDFYDFRIWRTTAEVIDAYWQHAIYLATYSEIISAALSYPGHSLVGIQALATDRLSGSRPKLTELAVGEPLSVPVAANRYDTTVASDGGRDTNTGLRSVTVNTVLPAYDGSTCFWLVRMDSAGYAQPDRLLTKFFLRVESWTPGDSQTVLRIRSSEEIPASTSVMLFSETNAPTKNTAWVLAKVLIEGSSGRITASKIDWDSFAVWDAWNEELVYDPVSQTYVKRHVFDGIIDFQADLQTIALKIAGTARGMYYSAGGKYIVVADKAGYYKGVFNEANCKNVVVNPIPRSNRANILVASFLDENNQYTSTPIAEDDVQGNEYPITKTLDPTVGVTREFQQRNLLNWALAQNREIDHGIQFDVGSDGIELEAGYIFKFQSKAVDSSTGGRIKQIKATTVILDQKVQATGEEWRLTIWPKSGVAVEWQGVLTGETDEIGKPEGLADSMPYEYPYILNKLSEDENLYRALNIKTSPSTMFSTITALQYKDSVYTNIIGG